MATLKINTNIAEVSDQIAKRLAKLKDKDYLLRPVCLDLIELMKKRIHEDGQAADGSAIGNYSSKYLRLRQSKYGRTTDSRIIVSLTRQLENDWSLIATAKGYGVGFKNQLNLQKARWVEEKKSKAIFSLTTQEDQYAKDYLNDLVKQALEND